MKYILPLVIMIVFFSILIGANIYLTRRFSWYFSIDNTRILYFIFGSLTIFMMVGTMAFTNGNSLISTILYGAATLSIGFLLYLVLNTIIVDLISLISNWHPVLYGILVLSLTTLLTVGGVWNAFTIKTTNHEIEIKGLTDDIRAVHLTDIHLGHYRGKNFLEKVVEKSNAQNPDVVLITGDLYDGRINLNDKTLSPLADLNAPVFFVEGNHDNYSGVRLIKKMLRDLGVTVLENEITEWNDLQIIGLNHMIADHSSYDMHANEGGSTVSSVLDSLSPDQNRPSLLLHHSPDGIKYANKHGVDLYLAGHTHAGQLFPVNQIGKLIFEYNRGLHDYEGTKIFVSEGIGTFGPPMRIGTKSELAVLTLTSKK